LIRRKKDFSAILSEAHFTIIQKIEKKAKIKMKLKTEDRDDNMEVDNEPEEELKVEKSSKERNTE